MNQLSETASQSAMKQSIKVALQSSADRAAHYQVVWFLFATVKRMVTLKE